ncbi:MAG: regulatory protein RecX, partial [Nitrospirae bacterium]|nr:regulatory protein RecX [Nitrospirota bacterium]
LRLLSYRSRSRKELTERLVQKGFDADTVDSIVAALEQEGLVRDNALASELLRVAVEGKGLGREGVRALLIKRGIERELIKETLSGLTKETEEETALRLVEKKLKTLKVCPEDTVRQKLWGLLKRRGFSTDVINTAFKSLNGGKG